MPWSPALARGSLSDGCGPVWRAVGAELDGVTAFGCEAVCTLAAMAGAEGSGVQAKREPKGKCWTTGNLERTSALYIFIIPYFGEVSMSERRVGWRGRYLVDLRPSGFHARHIVQDRAVLPEWTLLYVVNEADGAEVHIPASLSLYGG